MNLRYLTSLPTRIHGESNMCVEYTDVVSVRMFYLYLFYFKTL